MKTTHLLSRLIPGLDCENRGGGVLVLKGQPAAIEGQISQALIGQFESAISTVEAEWMEVKWMPGKRRQAVEWWAADGTKGRIEIDPRSSQ